MANVGTTITDYFTNTVEMTSMASVDDWFEVSAHSSEYAFAADVSSSANFTIALEANFNGNGSWFTIDTIPAKPPQKFGCELRPSHLARFPLFHMSSLLTTAETE
jgi:hypothetical protein